MEDLDELYVKQQGLVNHATILEHKVQCPLALHINDRCLAKRQQATAGVDSEGEII